MSNPVFDRIDKNVRAGYAGFGGGRPGNPSGGPYPPQDTPQRSAQPQDARGQAAHPPVWGPEQLDDLYRQPSAGPVQMKRLTVDDVVMKATGLFSLMLVMAAISWFVIAPMPGVGTVALLGSIVVTLVLGLVIAFKKAVSVPLIVAYAGFEGVLVGTVSRFYDARWSGIVTTAVIATLSVFAGMLLGYRTGLIKVTSKSRRIFGMALMGYLIFALVNLGFAMFGANQGWGLFGRGSLMGILISVLAVGLASYSLAMDFDSISRAVTAQVPEKYSWLLAHGLIVTLVWLYLEILRLLGHLQGND